jgi:hypothetical protein
LAAAFGAGFAAGLVAGFLALAVALLAAGLRAAVFLAAAFFAGFLAVFAAVFLRAAALVFLVLAAAAFGAFLALLFVLVLDFDFADFAMMSSCLPRQPLPHRRRQRADERCRLQRYQTFAAGNSGSLQTRNNETDQV